MKRVLTSQSRMRASATASRVFETTLLLVSFLCLATTVAAQMTPTGNVDIKWGTPNDGVVQQTAEGVFAYIVVNESDASLVHYDVSDPANPVYLGDLPTPGWPINLAILQDYIFVPGTGGQVAIFDATYPYDVTLLETFDNGTNNRIRGIAVVDIDETTRYAYLDCDDVGFEVWDFSDLGAAIFLGRYDHPAEPSAWRITIDSACQYAYVAGNYPLGFFHIYDVTDPANPDRLYTHAPAEKVWNAVVSGSGETAFLATSTGLSILDVSNPSAPTSIIDFEPQSTDPFDEDVYYQGLFLSDTESHLLMAGAGGFEPSFSYELIGYDDPIPEGFEVVNYAADIQNGLMRVGMVEPGYGTLKGGLQIIDVSDISNPLDVGTYTDPHDAIAFNSVDVIGSTAYVVDRLMGLRTFDVSVPASPGLTGVGHCSGEVDDVYVHEDHAFVVQNLGGGFAVVDIADEANPQRLSYYHTGLEPWEIIGYQDQYIYMGSGRPGSCWGLEVVDVSAPSNPLFHARYPMENWILGEAIIEGNYLYAAGGYVYDLSDPAHPVLSGNMHNESQLAWGVGILKAGPQVYLAKSRWPSGEYGLASFMIVDVSDIAGLGPVMIGACATPQMPDCGSGQCIAVDPNTIFETVYISLGSSGIGVIDVTDPANPVYVGAITEDVEGHPLGDVCSFAIVGDYLYISGYYSSGALTEYDISAGVENLELVSQVPNTFYGWSTQVQDGFAYRTRLNGLDLVEVPNAIQLDNTPPADVTGFMATAQGHYITLEWVNPVDDDHVATKIIRKADSYPATVVDGRQVYDGRETVFEDFDVDSVTTYFYTAFAYDEVQNYSSAVPSAQGSAYIADPYPPATVTSFTAIGKDGEVLLKWRGPADSDLAGTRVVRTDDGYPNDPDDGIPIFDGPGDSCIDSGVENGLLYYYTAFAYDEVPNYSPATESAQDDAVPQVVRFDDTFEEEILATVPTRWAIPAEDDTHSFRVYDDSRLGWWGATYPLDSKTIGAWGIYGGDRHNGWIDDPPGVTFGESTIHLDIMDPDFGFSNNEFEVIYFGYQDEYNYGELMFKPHYLDSAWLRQYVDGVEVINHRMDWSMTSGTDERWYHAKLDVNETGLELDLDGTLIFDLAGDQIYHRVHDDYASSTLPVPYTFMDGRIGVGVRTGAYFDNVVVTGNRPPEAFDLLHPVDGDTIYADTLSLDWQDSIDPDPADSVWFALHIALDPEALDSPESVVADSLRESGYVWRPLAEAAVIRNGAAVDTTWYWSVRSYDNYGDSRRSNQSWSFYLAVTSSSVPIQDGGATLPTRFALFHSSPNPFNRSSIIRYDLPIACRVTIEVFNIRGQKIATLVDRHEDAGYKTTRWDSRCDNGAEAVNGIYFYRIRAGDFTASWRVVLLK